MKNNWIQSAVLFAAILVIASCNQLKPENRIVSVQASDSLLVIRLPNAKCENCQKVVESGMSKIDGVKQTVLNLHTKEVSIVYNPNIVATVELSKNVKILETQMPCN
ncbi:MAG: heavy-metal-associated domain-containing protein [Bacteroidia bacterium]|nr:heavy-metal-associated domain-containing protein [Bacteroidia bacterium]